ncbi:MAG: methyl-accepting chemotaxis protein, partial [Gammaproteobacteria bacterium]|nr:methyl-accepting chemotaxis protein [Gammaproteobacteria bacterium]
TQQNAALVEEAAAASESMSEQSSNLQQQISFFNVGDTGSRTTSRPATSPTHASTTQGSATDDCRRGVDRPFTQSSESQAALEMPAKTTSTAKTGTDDEWSEF